MKSLKALFIAAAAACALGSAAPASAAPDNGTIDYIHNDSKVVVDFERGNVRIVYTTPRPGMVHVGVHAGTLLFEGTIAEDNTMKGWAYVFKQGCQPAKYYVEGMFIDEDGTITLNGAAPIFASGSSCQIAGYSSVSHNSELLFYYNDRS